MQLMEVPPTGKPKPPKLPPESYTLTKEFKAVCLREIAVPAKMIQGDNPEAIANYCRAVLPTDPRYNHEVECFVVVMLNTRRKIKGYNLVATGTNDTLLVHPREAYRLAVMTAAAAIVFVHNHPSGDPTPSEADIKVTRDLVRAGQVLKIECLDHVILGHKDGVSHSSLRELGYFYA